VVAIDKNEGPRFRSGGADHRHNLRRESRP
jgi:hypothetical protein